MRPEENKSTLKHFADRVCAAVHAKGSPVVVGLDPRPEGLPPGLLSDCRGKFGDSPLAYAAAFWSFNRGIIDAVHDVVPAVKPQLAFYERYGIAGLMAYARTTAYAREAGLLVVADGKRNDIGSTADAYAEAFLRVPEALEQPADGESGYFDYFHDFVHFGADALTVNPYLGHDGVDPFINWADRHGRGVFVLVRTSNRSAADVQDLWVGKQPLYERIGELVKQWGERSRGHSGYSCVGAVVGATWPQQAARLREIMPNTLFLVPGYGAQGATAADVACCFDAADRGALVNASRSIIFAWRSKPCAERNPETKYGEAARQAAQRMTEDIHIAQRQFFGA
ncbi:MAG: orotidine-5'-phosphate decarboxylase [Candidatus Tectomicrobia bacterium]|nr:orotidine-5'-phosphate decarboxylase [Candidatus Tectomicrobia bacterium]